MNSSSLNNTLIILPIIKKGEEKQEYSLILFRETG